VIERTDAGGSVQLVLCADLQRHRCQRERRYRRSQHEFSHQTLLLIAGLPN
jgi:hypothetical protein